jgi:hypothetical protein
MFIGFTEFVGFVEFKRYRIQGFQGPRVQGAKNIGSPAQTCGIYDKGSSEGRKDNRLKESGFGFSFDVGRWMFDVHWKKKGSEGPRVRVKDKGVMLDGR